MTPADAASLAARVKELDAEVVRLEGELDDARVDVLRAEAQRDARDDAVELLKDWLSDFITLDELRDRLGVRR